MKRHSVSLLYTRFVNSGSQTDMRMRSSIVEAVSQEEALGKAIGEQIKHMTGFGLILHTVLDIEDKIPEPEVIAPKEEEKVLAFPYTSVSIANKEYVGYVVICRLYNGVINYQEFDHSEYDLARVCFELSSSMNDVQDSFLHVTGRKEIQTEAERILVKTYLDRIKQEEINAKPFVIIEKMGISINFRYHKTLDEAEADLKKNYTDGCVIYNTKTEYIINVSGTITEANVLVKHFLEILSYGN